MFPALKALDICSLIFSFVLVSWLVVGASPPPPPLWGQVKCRGCMWDKEGDVGPSRRQDEVGQLGSFEKNEGVIDT